MAQNDKLLLDQVIEEHKSKNTPEYSPSEFFELFTAEQILKSYELTNEDIDAGIVDGGNDGGIDSLYAFVDENLLVSTDDLKSFAKEGVSIELVVIQSKQSSSFEEKVVTNLVMTMDDLLNMETDIEKLSTTYNAKIISVFSDFREAISQLSSVFPIIRFRFFYVTKGDSSAVHPNVSRRKEALKNKIAEYFSDSVVKNISQSMGVVKA